MKNSYFRHSKVAIAAPLVLLVAAQFIPALPLLGSVPATMKALASFVFFGAGLTLGCLLTRDKPTRGEVFLASVALAFAFFFWGADSAVGWVNQQTFAARQVETEYLGIREESGKQGPGTRKYSVLVSLPGDPSTSARPAVVPIPEALYQQLLAHMPTARAPLTLTLPSGLLGLFSVEGMGTAEPTPTLQARRSYPTGG